MGWFTPNAQFVRFTQTMQLSIIAIVTKNVKFEVKFNHSGYFLANSLLSWFTRFFCVYFVTSKFRLCKSFDKFHVWLSPEPKIRKEKFNERIEYCCYKYAFVSCFEMNHSRWRISAITPCYYELLSWSNPLQYPYYHSLQTHHKFWLILEF